MQLYYLGAKKSAEQTEAYTLPQKVFCTMVYIVKVIYTGESDENLCVTKRERQFFPA